jgi:uncharacterized protein YggE
MEQGRSQRVWVLRLGLVAAAALALALLTPAVAPAQERTITVKGSATQEVPNDAASVGLSVSKERRTRQAALRAMAASLRAVIAAVQTIPGVGPGAITTGVISVREITRDERKFYRASEGISVVLGQPDRAGELISAAISAGATGTRGPNFFPSDPEIAYRNTLLAAFDIAYQKAAALAIRAGALLGPPITIEEASDIAPTPAAAAPRQRGAEAPPPVKPGGSTVTATVRVVFALQ